MENEKFDSDAAAQQALEKPESASKSGILNAIDRLLAEPKPSIKTLDALSEVQSTAPPLHESVREAGMAGDIYRIDDQDCGGITR